MSKTGLVLEGGGFRGIYTAGVLDVFLERGISFDGVIGVSAGAIHACSYLSKQRGRSIRYYKKYCKDWRFMSFRSWIKTGDIVGADFCYHELPDKLDIYDHEAFEADSIPFYAVCTNVETGESEYFSITDLRAQIDHVRASASLPYFSRIVELEDKKLQDRIIEIDLNIYTVRDRVTSYILIFAIALIILSLFSGVMVHILNGVFCLILIPYMFWVIHVCKEPVVSYLVEHDHKQIQDYAFTHSLTPMYKKRKELAKDLVHCAKEISILESKKQEIENLELL